MPKSVIYLRVSTDEQAASGLGLEAQASACRAAADRLGLEACETRSDEGVSGAAPLDRRPGLLEAVALLAKGDALVVAKRDRLGRDPIAVAAIEAAVARRGARVVSAAGEGTEGDDPGQVLMRRMVDAFAEYERLIIKARTRAALGAKARRGERTGQVPYGKALAGDGVALVDDQVELDLLALIRARARRGMSPRAIARELDAQGVPTKTGGRWAHSTIRRLLTKGDQHDGQRTAPGTDGPGPAPGDHPGSGPEGGRGRPHGRGGPPPGGTVPLG